MKMAFISFARLVGAAVLAGATLLSSSFIAQTPAAAATLPASSLTPDGQNTFDQLTQCVATRGSLLAMLLVDDTGTLNTMDPDVARRDAVLEVLTALEEIVGQTTADGREVLVEASMAMFGGLRAGDPGYREVAGWGSLAGPHAEELARIAETQIVNPAPGRDTNFARALEGASNSINERSAQLEAQPCTAIFWFTDGKPDVGPGNVAATEASVDEICRPTGIIDTIRQSGTALVAMALFTDVTGRDDVPASHIVSQQDRDWLQAVAESTGPLGANCGTPPAFLSPGSVGGAYLMAQDGAQLIRQFAGVGAMLQGAAPGEVNVTNSAGPIYFPVDHAVGRVRLAFTVENPGPVPVVLPDGSSLDLTSASHNPGGLTVDVRGSGGAFVATISSAVGLPPGTWKIPQADGTTPIVVTDIYYFWDVELEILAPEGIRIGERNPISITRKRAGLSDPTTDALGKHYSTLPIQVLVDGIAIPPNQITANADGTWELILDKTGDSVATSTQLVVTVRSTTAPSEINLGPVTASVVLPVALPAGFPSVVTTGTLDFGTFAAGETPTRKITLQGSDQGSSQVCIGAQTFTTQPDGVEVGLNFDGTSTGGCFELPADNQVDISISISAKSPGEGQIAGTVPITLYPVRGDEPQTLHLPFEARMFRPIDESVRVAWLAGALITAALLAWVVAAVGRHLTDRFRGDNFVDVAQVPVLLDENGLTRRTPLPSGALLDLDDFRSATRRPPSGRLSTNEGLTFSRRGPLVWPWKSFTPWVRSAKATTTAISGGQAPTAFAPAKKGTKLDSFAYASNSYLVTDSQNANPGQSLQGTLIVFAESPDGSKSERVSQANTGLMSYSGWSSVYQNHFDQAGGSASVEPGPTYSTQVDTVHTTFPTDATSVIATQAATTDPTLTIETPPPASGDAWSSW